MYAVKNRVRRSRRAFTLLEILLVVGLLALLAAFAIPAVVGRGEQAKIKMVEAAIGPNGAISNAIKMFHFDMGSYPEELKDLVEKPSDSDLAEKWKSPYLEDVKGLTDPWGSDYQFKPDGDHNEGRYDLWSMGPDRIDGNEDDITNWEDDR